MSEPADVDYARLPPVPDGGGTLGAEWALAMGHLRAKKHAFVSIVSLFAISGVTIGLAALNIVIAVMTGFELDLRDKILGSNAHVVVLRYGGPVLDPAETVAAVERVEGVEAAAPFVYSEMIVRSAWQSSGVILKGIDPETTWRVTALRDDLVYGPTGELQTAEERHKVFTAMAGTFPGRGPDDEALPGIIIGRELMDQLQVGPGDRVQLINPLGGGGGLLGMPSPTIRNVRVAGVFYSGMYEYDTKWTYIANDVAQDFLKLGDKVSGIEVKAVDVDAARDVAVAVEAAIGYPHYARPWQSLNAALFEALELEKIVMGLILSLIVVVAGLLVVTTLIMMVITKGRQIAILKAIGASSASILRIFMMEGLVIGVTGLVLGTLIGYLGCIGLDRYEFPIETDVYYLSSLPVVILPSNFMVTGLATLAVCFLATLYPAWEAARLNPVDGLRYE